MLELRRTPSLATLPPPSSSPWRAGSTGANDARRSQRPQSARTPASSPMAAVAATAHKQQERPLPNPKPQTWAPPAATAKVPSARMAAATAAAAPTAAGTTEPATKTSSANNGGKHSNLVAGEEDAASATAAAAAATATDRGGAYARLFGMKHPGAHRRVGVDPLDGFKKDHYRGSTIPTDASATFVGDGGVVSDAKGGRTGQEAGVRGGDLNRAKKASGEVSSDKYKAGLEVEHLFGRS